MTDGDADAWTNKFMLAKDIEVIDKDEDESLSDSPSSSSGEEMDFSKWEKE